MNRKKTPTPPAAQTPDELQAALEKMHSKDKGEHSYNFRIPSDLYQKIETHTEKTGQSVKGFLIVCVREFFERNS